MLKPNIRDKITFLELVARNSFTGTDSKKIANLVFYLLRQCISMIEAKQTEADTYVYNHIMNFAKREGLLHHEHFRGVMEKLAGYLLEEEKQRENTESMSNFLIE